MVGPIDAISSAPPPVSQAPAAAPSAPSDSPDLRDTQAGVTAAEATAHASASAAKTGPEKELEDAINERVARLLGSNISLRVEVDKGSGDFVYKSVNKDTGEVERQYPAETILRMLAFFRELDGLLFDQKA